MAMQGAAGPGNRQVNLAGFLRKPLIYGTVRRQAAAPESHKGVTGYHAPVRHHRDPADVKALPQQLHHLDQHLLICGVAGEELALRPAGRGSG